jgi:8-oxo-dGTP diphosphatase
MKSYVLGFIIDPHLDQVLLMKKKRPDWQKDRLNGIGGKIEPGETPEAAMVREGNEEVHLPYGMTWRKFCRLSGPKNGGTLGAHQEAFETFCFYTKWPLRQGTVMLFREREDEKVWPYFVRELPKEVLPNIPWLVNMAISMERGERSACFDVQEVLPSRKDEP